MQARQVLRLYSCLGGEHSHLTIVYITGVHMRYDCEVVYQRNSTKDLPLAGCDGSCETTFANTCPDLPVFFISRLVNSPEELTDNLKGRPHLMT
jgi:hypothetical protein